MDISDEQYKIVFTNDCKNEMDFIYNYISNNLYASNSANKLMETIEEKIQNLKFMPKIYPVIKRYDKLSMEYRKILIDNYVIVYTISESAKVVYIVHIYYSGNNYLIKL